ncbi:hypothetical protein [Agromyces neolithicus]|uniref:DUF8175 domain-containing protein n=1 Tax=Agromyces neolithicus TaxID=269420 RepID=A0ABN2MDJ0_9MICO
MGRFREAANDAWSSPGAKIAAITVLALCGLIALVVIFLSVFYPVKPGNDGSATAAPTETPRPSQSQAPTSPAEAGACNTPRGDTSYMPALPSDLRWTAAGGVAWPVSDEYGPTKTDDGHGVCFAQSPLGAALLLATMTASTSQQSSTVDDYLFYIQDSVGKDVFAEAFAGYSGASSDLATGRSNIAGFRTVAFSPNEAQIGLVLTAPGTATGYLEGYFTLDWVNDDWRVRVTNDGAFAPVPFAAVAEGGFVDWRDQ